jgi:hypothetical protein
MTLKPKKIGLFNFTAAANESQYKNIIVDNKSNIKIESLH